jgi:hypothetical protein
MLLGMYESWSCQIRRIGLLTEYRFYHIQVHLSYIFINNDYLKCFVGHSIVVKNCVLCVKFWFDVFYIIYLQINMKRPKSN